MPDGIRWVGLDVHARASMVAIFDQATGEVVTRRVAGRPHELLGVLREIPRPARMVYEAGPTGYGLARRRPGGGDRARGLRAGPHRASAGGPGQDRRARRDPARATVGGRGVDAGHDPVGGA